MHIVVVGCGRVGSTVAGELSRMQHDVVVIDRNVDAFRRLGDTFGGSTLIGVGFDRATLEAAGVTSDSAVLAVTSGDNSNILIARVARETFGVDRVVARIYDARRARLYERLGIPTVASVAWTSARVMRAALPHGTETEWEDPTSGFSLVERRIRAAGAGHAVAEVAAAGGRVCLITRNGQPTMPTEAMLLQQDDVVHIMVGRDGGRAVDALLAGESADHSAQGAH